MCLVMQLHVLPFFDFRPHIATILPLDVSEQTRQRYLQGLLQIVHNLLAYVAAA